MRKVIFAMNMSLDGFIEGRDGDLSWSNPDDELFKHFLDLDASMDLHFVGRRLYQNMAAFWPTVEDNYAASALEKEYSRVWKKMPKVVVSRSLEKVEWNSTLLRDNLEAEVKKYKSLPGGDMSVAGAELAASFLQLGLVDEFQVYIHPVIIGEGKPMFQRLSKQIKLQLVETRAFGSGVVLLKYKVLP